MAILHNEAKKVELVNRVGTMKSNVRWALINIWPLIRYYWSFPQNNSQQLIFYNYEVYSL